MDKFSIVRYICPQVGSVRGCYNCQHKVNHLLLDNCEDSCGKSCKCLSIIVGENFNLDRVL